MYEFGINGGSFNDPNYHPSKIMPAMGPLAASVRWVRLWYTTTTLSDNPANADWSICQAWRALGVDVILVLNVQEMGSGIEAKLALWIDSFSFAFETGVRVMEVSNEWDYAQSQWTGGIPLLAQFHVLVANSMWPKGYLSCASNTLGGISNMDKLYAASPGGKLPCHFIGNHSYAANPAAKLITDQATQAYAITKNVKVLNSESQMHEALTSSKAPWDAANPTQWAMDTTTMLKNCRTLDGIFCQFSIDWNSGQHAGPCGIFKWQNGTVGGTRIANQPFFNAYVAGLAA
jgi:hypothetical protein